MLTQLARQIRVRIEAEFAGTNVCSIWVPSDVEVILIGDYIKLYITATEVKVHCARPEHGRVVWAMKQLGVIPLGDPNFYKSLLSMLKELDGEYDFFSTTSDFGKPVVWD